MILTANPDQSETEISDTESNNLKLWRKSIAVHTKGPRLHQIYQFDSISG